MQLDFHDLFLLIRKFQVNTKVMEKKFNDTYHVIHCKWLPGKVTSIRGPFSVTVELADGCSARLHDHICACSLTETETERCSSKTAVKMKWFKNQFWSEPFPEMETEEQLKSTPPLEDQDSRPTLYCQA